MKKDFSKSPKILFVNSVAFVVISLVKLFILRESCIVLLKSMTP